MKTYLIRDVDNSCTDPDCCTPCPFLIAIEDTSGPLYKAEEFLKALGLQTTKDDQEDLFIEATDRARQILSSQKG